VLDQHPDGDLVRQPDIGSDKTALANLPAQRLDVLGDARGEPVAELRVAVEPLQLVIGPGDLERAPGDLRDARQRRRYARVEQPGPAPEQRDQEDLGFRVQVKRQHGAVTIRRDGARGRVRRAARATRPTMPPRDRDHDLQPVVEHGA
jgi:hypothetical protein